jgi:hypothetical protein
MMHDLMVKCLHEKIARPAATSQEVSKSDRVSYLTAADLQDMRRVYGESA